MPCANPNPKIGSVFGGQVSFQRRFGLRSAAMRRARTVARGRRVCPAGMHQFVGPVGFDTPAGHLPTTKRIQAQFQFGSGPNLIGQIGLSSYFVGVASPLTPRNHPHLIITVINCSYTPGG